MSQILVTGEAKIRDIQGPVVANSGVITALDGAASQYVRGDGTLADFPTSSGGGSSVSYYLNSSVSQGTIGGVAYRELSKEPIIGAGTDIAISSNGYVASYLTDANDPDVLSIPGGNFNCEFYFSVNNNTGNPFFYAELYKYDGTTFTLLGSSVGVPEYINQGTIIAPYYFAIPVATATLALTDRLAIRIYVNVDGRTVTLHTENGHLCQVVTTLSKGMVSLNNLTDQSQFLTTGTSGTNFAIVSSGDTHTFNLPIASATNTGKLSSTDWSTFNNKQAALSFTAPLVNTSNTISIPVATSLVDGYLDNLDWVKFDTAYNRSLTSAAVTGTTTKTLTLNKQDGGTITASWTDDNTDAVTSVFGRTGAVVAVSGDYNTSQVTENTNLYFTNARSRAALSFTAGSGAYNSTTGLITIPTNTNQLTNGASYITLTSLSAGTGITYNNTTGVITNSAPDQTVSLTQGAGISISGTYPSFTIASTITQYTDALARAALSFVAGSGAYNSTTGVITIPTNNNQITNGSNFITLTSLSAGTGISYNSTTGVITNTITQYTDALARAAISLTTTGTSGAATYNSTTGVFNIPNYTTDLSGYVPYTGATSAVNLGANSLTARGITVTKSAGISTITFPAGTNDPAFIQHEESTANTGIMRFSVGDDNDANDHFVFGNLTLPNAFRINANGIVSIGTWQGTAIADAYIASAATWNAKQNALTNPVTGTGTLNYVSKFTATGSTIGSSLIYDNGTSVAIGTATPVSTEIFTLSTNGVTIMTLENRTGTTKNNQIIFKDNTSVLWRIGTDVATNNNTNNFQFYNSVNATATLTLASNNLATFSNSVYSGASGTTQGQFSVYSTTANAEGNIYGRAGGGMLLNTNGNNHPIELGGSSVIINPNLGIGTLTPGFKLVVVKEDNTTGTIASFNANNLTQATEIWYGGIRMGGTSNPVTLNLESKGIGPILLNPNTAGNILIGTGTDNGSRLQVAGAATFSSSVTAATTFFGRNTFGTAGTNASPVFEDLLVGLNGNNAPAKIQIGNSFASSAGSWLKFVVNSNGAGNTPVDVMTLKYDGNVGIGPTSPSNKLDVANNTRSGTHLSSQALYVTGDMDSGDFGRTTGNNVEFRHSNGTQGIGFGYNSIYATGSSANQNLCLTSRGTSNLILNGNANGAYTSGSVLVNTGSGVSGGGALQVNGNVNINGVFQINGVTIGGGGGSGVTGSGTTSYVPKWSSASSLSNSIMYDTGTNVGFNTTSPQDRVDINGSLRIRANTPNFTAAVDNAVIDFVPTSIFASNPCIRMAAIGTASVAAEIRFLTGTSTTLDERARFTGGGNLLIGTTSDNGYKINLNGSISFAYGFTNVFRGSSGPNDILVGNTGSTFYVGGSVTATGGFFDTSDSRLKILVKDYEQPKGIENVAARMYLKNNRKELGYYAQDLEEILPSAVSEGSDGFLTLSYSQVHTAKIAYLEKEVAELKELIKSLL